MNIKYEFCNETVNIEVSEEWATVLAELDRQEYNDNHRETRRHCSLEALNLDDAYLPSDMDLEADIEKVLQAEHLRGVIDTLEPQQKELLHRVYVNGERMSAIAKEEGVSKAAITQRMKRIYADLQKKLKNMDIGG